MGYNGVLAVFLAILGSLAVLPLAQSAEVDLSQEASFLNPNSQQSYAIQLIKPLPRRNSGCETIFKKGEALDSCDPNYGLDPEKDGVFRTYCEWNLNSHYQKENQSHWLESYENPDPIAITSAVVGYHLNGTYSTVWHQLRGAEKIKSRWIEISFNDQITGSVLGSLKCYPSYYTLDSKLAGTHSYHHHLSPRENDQKIKSGLSIGNILEQLRGYIKIIRIN